MPAHNFSYPSSAAAVVFGGHLSARAAFRFDRKSPAMGIFLYGQTLIGIIINKIHDKIYFNSIIFIPHSDCWAI